MVRLLSLLHPFKTLRASYFDIAHVSLELPNVTYTAGVWQQHGPGTASSATGPSPMGSEYSEQSQVLIRGFVNSSSKL